MEDDCHGDIWQVDVGQFSVLPVGLLRKFLPQHLFWICGNVKVCPSFSVSNHSDLIKSYKNKLQGKMLRTLDNHTDCIHRAILQFNRPPKSNENRPKIKNHQFESSLIRPGLRSDRIISYWSTQIEWNLLAGTVAQFGHDDQMTFDIQPPQRMLKTNHDLTTLSDAMPSMPCQKLGEKEFGAYKTTSIGEFVLFYPYPWFVL